MQDATYSVIQGLNTGEARSERRTRTPIDVECRSEREECLILGPLSVWELVAAVERRWQASTRAPKEFPGAEAAESGEALEA